MSLCIFLNTNNADNTNIIFAHGGAERNVEFWMLNVELLRLAAMWNWPMMNFNALTRCFEHEIHRRPTDRREVIKRMSRIFFCTRRRGAQCWVLNVECWIVAAGRNVELTNDEFRCSHEMFWTRDSPKAHWPQGGNNANDTNNYLHADLALYLKRTPIARMHVRVGTLTWGLLNENDTNEINMDSIRGVWTHIAFVRFLK